MELYKSLTKDIAVLLCDDPEAELDFTHRGLMIESVRELPIQCFITGNDSATWTASQDDLKFHVNHGALEIIS